MSLCGLVLSSTAVGCGGSGDSPATTARTAAAAAPTTQPAPAPATVPTATTDQPTQDAGEGEEDRATGDEEPMRVPAAFTVAGGTLAPRRVTVPAFLTVELRLTAQREAATVTIDLPGGPRAFAVGAGSTARRRIAGLHPGDYDVRTAQGGHAVLHVVAGGAPGP